MTIPAIHLLLAAFLAAPYLFYFAGRRFGRRFLWRLSA